jgi:hypothetical protein
MNRNRFAEKEAKNGKCDSFLENCFARNSLIFTFKRKIVAKKNLKYSFW